MGIHDRDYWGDKHREIEQGDSAKVRPKQVSARAVARPDIEPNRLRSGPPDLGQVFTRWWFQLLIWIAVGAVLFAIFRHLPQH